MITGVTPTLAKTLFTDLSGVVREYNRLRSNVLNDLDNLKDVGSIRPYADARRKANERNSVHDVIVHLGIDKEFPNSYESAMAGKYDPSTFSIVREDGEAFSEFNTEFATLISVNIPRNQYLYELDYLYSVGAIYGKEFDQVILEIDYQESTIDFIPAVNGKQHSLASLNTIPGTDPIQALHTFNDVYRKDI